YQTIGDAKARKAAVPAGRGVWGGRNALLELEPKLHAGIAQMGGGSYADSFRQKFIDWLDRGKQIIYPRNRNDADVSTAEVDAWAADVEEIYAMLRSLDAHLSSARAAVAVAMTAEAAPDDAPLGKVAARRKNIE